MVLQYLDALNRLRFVLASGSPRRRDILQGIGLTHLETVVSDFAEDLRPEDFGNGGDYALSTARCKADEVVERLERDPPPGEAPTRSVDILLAADTVVTFEEDLPSGKKLHIIGKAKSAEDARALLKMLSGRTHEVWTGLVVVYRCARTGQLQRCEATVCTKVQLAPLSDGLLEAYLATPRNWQGKAGAYGIQDMAGCFVEGIDGDYYNVMGLPLQRLCAILEDLFASGHLA